jgi:hypothetical protein
VNFVRDSLGRYRVSERRACRVLNQPRSTQRRKRFVPNDEPRLVREIIKLASQFGRYSYRRITGILRNRGWKVIHNLLRLGCFSGTFRPFCLQRRSTKLYTFSPLFTGGAYFCYNRRHSSLEWFQATPNGISRFTLLPVIHSFLMSDRRCVSAVESFLEHGRFDLEREPQPIL